MTAPAVLAAQLVRADAALHAHVTVGVALKQQQIVLRLSDRPALARRVIRLLPSKLARDVTDDVLAHRELARLTPARPLSAFRVGPAAAAAKLRAYYAEAERRSGIAWQVLAAVNYVESDFGRVRQSSVAGAQGPMQFMPSSWRAYGHGNVHDPHQAILAAARFLHAAGGTIDERRCIATTPRGPMWTRSSATQAGSAAIRRPFSCSTPAASSSGRRRATDD
jgi:soluble lytic murein transglycosylase-like protein